MMVMSFEIEMKPQLDEFIVYLSVAGTEINNSKN